MGYRADRAPPALPLPPCDGECQAVCPVCDTGVLVDAFIYALVLFSACID